jgi:AhpD family alkylhydroperoxidase
MAGRFTRTAADRGLAQIRHVHPVRQGAARSYTASVYAQVERDFGMLAPPVALHSPAPRPLAAAWSILRETLVASGAVARAAKEAIAAAVSHGNSCPYCVDVHTAAMHGVAKGRDALLVAGDRIDAVADPGVREIAAWARASGRREDVERHGWPVPRAQAPELIGVAVTFQYYNRMAHMFLPGSPIPSQVPAAAKGTLWRLLGSFMWRAARGNHEPGASLSLLPPVELPEELAWAGGSHHIGGAFARASAAFAGAGVRSAPPAVHELVHSRLAQWHGQPAPLSRAWVDDAVTGLAAGERATGRLALLAAFAPYQVDDAVIAEFRQDQPDDRTLVELTSWASFAAAVRVGSWLDTRGQPRAKPAAEPPAA